MEIKSGSPVPLDMLPPEMKTVVSGSPVPANMLPVDISSQPPPPAAPAATAQSFQYQPADLGKTLGNLPKSTYGLISGTLKGAADIAQHPVTAGENVMNLLGGLEGLALGKMGLPAKALPDQEAAAQGFMDTLYSQYGTKENFKKTIENNPAQVLFDAASLMSGIGGGLKAGAAGAAGKELGSGILESMGTAAKIPGVAIKAAAGTMPETWTRKLYQTALKPSTAIKPLERDNIIDTLLNEKIPVTEAGYEKLQSTIDDINHQVKATIQSNADRPINPASVLNRVDDAIEVGKSGFDAAGNVSRILDVADAFMGNWGKDNLNVASAQTIKQDIYKQLKSNYDAASKSGRAIYTEPEVAAMKSIARGLKEEIEASVDSGSLEGKTIKELNARESALLKAEPSLRKAVGRTGNNNIFSLTDMLGALAGEGIGGAPGAVAGGLVMHGLKSKTSQTAILLNSLKAEAATMKPAIAAATATAGLGSIQGGTNAANGQ